MYAVYFLYTLLAVSLATTGEPVENACVESAASVQLTTQLLQIRGGPAGSALTPVGRSYVTFNAESAREFYMDVLKATEIEQNWTYTSDCAKSLSSTWDNKTFTFVQYHDPHSSSYIVQTSEEWSRLASNWGSCSKWTDNYDNFYVQNKSLVDTDVLADGEFLVQVTNGNTKFLVPLSLWGLEISGTPSSEASTLINRLRVLQPPTVDPSCVSSLSSEQILKINTPTQFWWRSTFASADPEAAASFAEKYLMARRFDSENPYGGNCTQNALVMLHGSNFQLNFVRSGGCEESSPTVDEWVEHQEDIRNLTLGAYDQHMSNRLILWAEQLDIFVSLLKSGNQQFFVSKMADDIYDLFITIPKNAITIQIRSYHYNDDGNMVEYVVACPPPGR